MSSNSEIIRLSIRSIPGAEFLQTEAMAFWISSIVKGLSSKLCGDRRTCGGSEGGKGEKEKEKDGSCNINAGAITHEGGHIFSMALRY